MKTTRSGKIISDGQQLFSVPNTEEGRQWMKLMRKYRNAGRVDVMTRGPKPGGQVRTKTEDAEWFAIYVTTAKSEFRLESAQRDCDYFRDKMKQAHKEALSTVADLLSMMEDSAGLLSGDHIPQEELFDVQDKLMERFSTVLNAMSRHDRRKYIERFPYLFEAQEAA